jgi:branched-chain amino acid transport system permease protein
MYGSLPRSLLLWPALVVVVGLMLPSFLNNYVLYIASGLIVYVVLALGLDLMMGRAGLFAFSHIAFFGIGAYMTSILQTTYGVPFPAGMVAAVIVSAVVGTLVAMASVRMRHIYLGLATVAFASGVHWIFQNWTSVTGGVDGFRLQPADFVIFQAIGDQASFRVLAVMFALVLLATFYLTRSKLGRSLTAIRDSEHVAAVSGISVERTKIWVFVISSAYASVAGSMLVVFNAFISPEAFHFAPAVLLLTMLVVGGMGTIPGVVIGSIIIGLLPEVLRTTMHEYLIWQEFVYGLILVVSITLMPQGIWGLITQTLAKNRRPS